MKKEDLFDGFGNLDEDLLMRSEQGGENMNKKRNISKIIRFGSVAACLVAALGIGIIFWSGKANNNKPAEDVNIAENGNRKSGDNIVEESGDDTSVMHKTEDVNIAESDDDISDMHKTQEEAEEPVDVSALLASNEGISDKDALYFSNVEIGKYVATYFKEPSVGSDVLGRSIGTEIKGTKNWYRVSGHEDLYYLISYNKDEYSLWKFAFFNKESYPYNDVLQLIYNIDSAEDITEIVVAPATMDNTDEGKAIQDEIGTVTIADKEDIKTIYDVLSGLTCYGNDKWEMIGLGDDTPSAMQKKVRAGRYLTFITSEKIEIDTLNYTGISGMFYEFYGIAYNKLSVEQKQIIEEILKI